MGASVKHLLGISGGKDSAALAIYLNRLYPNLDVEYYTCDTGKELKETYDLIDRLESALGKSIVKYSSFERAKRPLTTPLITSWLLTDITCQAPFLGGARKR